MIFVLVIKLLFMLTCFTSQAAAQTLLQMPVHNSVSIGTGQTLDSTLSQNKLVDPVLPEPDHTSQIDPNLSSPHLEFKLHKWINLICWGFLVDIGILLVRYGKAMNYWMGLHAIFMVILVVPSAVIEIYIATTRANLDSLIKDQALKNAHDIIGITFLVLIILQTLGGYTLRLIVLSSDLIVDPLIARRFHYVMGHLIYLMGKVQIGLGIYMVYTRSSNPTMIYSFWGLYFIVFFWRILFEGFYLSGLLYQWLAASPSQKKECKSSTEDLLQGYVSTRDQEALKVDFKNLIWVLFNDKIVDLTDLVHPGGQYIWHQVKGREVSRFLYGVYGLESTSSKAHAHSQLAFQLIERHTVGRINTVSIFIIDGHRSEFYIEQDFSLTKWKLTEVQVLNKQVRQFSFVNERIQLKRSHQSINSFGKYFLVRSAKNPKVPTRPYSIVMSMEEEEKEFRRKLIQFVDSVTKKRQDRSSSLKISKPDFEEPKLHNRISLLVKRYKRKGFSNYIFTHQDEEYLFEGPYGCGFDIPYSGKVAIICGGTGLFPVLDLVDYLLRKTMYQILLDRLGVEAADSINKNQQFDFSNKIFLTLFLAVNNKEDLIGSDIYLTLHRYQQYLKVPMFQLILRIDQPIQGVTCASGNFDIEFLVGQLDPIDDYCRFLVCGPPKMNQHVPEILKEIGVSDDCIYLI